MTFIQDDEVIQAFATDAPPEPFANRIRFRCVGRNANGRDACGSDCTIKALSILGVIITNEEVRSGFKRRGFTDLLSELHIGRMAGDTGMDDSSGGMVDDNKDEDRPKEHIVGLQQVTCPKGMGMLLQESRPGLGSGTRWTQLTQVALKGASSNGHAKFDQFASHALHSPGVIFRNQALDEGDGGRA